MLWYDMAIMPEIVLLITAMVYAATQRQVARKQNAVGLLSSYHGRNMSWLNGLVPV